jgi:hypothetical protein
MGAETEKRIDCRGPLGILKFQLLLVLIVMKRRRTSDAAMADHAEKEISVGSSNLVATSSRRSSRIPRPSSKARETIQVNGNSTGSEASMNDHDGSVLKRGDKIQRAKGDMLQKILDLLAS